MNVRTFKTLSVTAVAAGLLLGGIRTSHAQALTPIFVSAVPDSATTTLYTYNIGLEDTALVQNASPGPQSSLTLFDFNALVPGSETYTNAAYGTANGAAFTVSESATGINSPNTGIGQVDTGLPNINLLYTGSTINNETGVLQVLGTLTVDSQQPVVTTHALGYSSVARDGNTPPAGTNGSAAQAFVNGPAAVPEPGSVALMVGMGISGSAFLLRRRKAAK
jgi:hypothetical protein